MFRYETHLHTYPVSRCAKKSVRENEQDFIARMMNGEMHIFETENPFI